MVLNTIEWAIKERKNVCMGKAKNKSKQCPSLFAPNESAPIMKIEINFEPPMDSLFSWKSASRGICSGRTAESKPHYALPLGLRVRTPQPFLLTFVWAKGKLGQNLIHTEVNTQFAKVITVLSES